jgi:LysM repeat protein
MVATVVVAVLVGAASPALAETHVVAGGETLAQIAARYHTTVSALVATNHLASANLIRTGQVLLIPGTSTPAGPVRHTVVEGETLAGIASQFHTSVMALVAANGITNPNVIAIGRVLVIPGATAGSTERTGGHIVRAGETLTGIGALYGIAPSSLAAWNGIVNGRLYVGARLLLSSPGSYTAPTTGTSQYVVRSGDNLARIASRFHTTVSALVAANHLANPNLIRIGATLTVTGTAGFQCPVIGASFMNDWGYPREGGRFHEGNDLMAKMGTPVHAPVSGTVEYVTGSIAGLEFRLVTSGGTYFIGAHLSARGKSGSVSAGDVIGYVGNAGNAAGGPTHVHFEIHPGGGPAVNPYPTLRAACG